VRFDVDADYLERFTVQNVGAAIHDELWVPSEELEEFNDHIVGAITLIESYRSE